ncbi:YbhB/YbcL family Raf kinase inhibitor-like protein [Pantoea sp. 1.19]|uniref:YbhB/YbcL family Raf kinase inhibitor-like protein n=1 Tax=Pantoea sp. 1.19 TaxID=1925589 RepID=UPI000948F0A7|nr:YbhB/YbcL family Raf kinase inhibitor-like protein [Pantoea sp. 1.19]
MKIVSTDFTDNAFLAKAQEFDGFGGSGENRSPALSWQDAPAGTASFAITCYDPDAPTGSGFWHWVAFNIPATVSALAANAGIASGEQMPAGSVQSINDYGLAGFGGACPPEGDKPHRYVFSVHALSVPSLALDASATNAVARFMIEAHTLAKASVTGLYQR